MRLSLLVLFAGTVAAAFFNRISCPPIHVLAARETTAPPGFGSAQALVDLILKVFPRATAQAIDYPAAGGANYSESVSLGIVAVLSQMQLVSARCPDTILVMHGYSQGAQIMDDAFCGGPDGSSLPETPPSLVSPSISAKVAAIIFMGDPRHVVGLPYNVGNATEPGFAARPVGFQCPAFSSRIQSYCDSPDPFCAKGDDAATHQGYPKVYGQQALDFIVSKFMVNKRSGKISMRGIASVTGVGRCDECGGRDSECA
ncbi:Acetylxylan esterase [Pleurostoma richardsiae]|uniref:Acetylxylan esterase n=1 Tax=Pleurostoma richardsiae TaxID=41990 RepID=A0AA38RMK0_9PEZI|nr:Acetylxylan esterase [Pleurostoma richardsiae]